MQQSTESVTQLLQEIFIPASNRVITERFNSTDESAASCSGKCASGGCQAIVDHE